MKEQTKNIKVSLLSFAVVSILSFGCMEVDDTYEVEEFEKPSFDGSASVTSIDYGSSVTFTDNSTLVHQRQWSFVGGNPASSSDQSVVVTYGSGGIYDAELSVTHIDNQVYTRKFVITVDGPAIQTFSLYTESSSVSFGNQVVPQNNNAYANLGSTTSESFEGDESMYFDFDNVDTWGTQGSLLADGGIVDISEYADGLYNVALKTTSQKRVLIRMHGLSLVPDSLSQEERAILTLDPAEDSYGLKRDGAWYVLQIPIQDFVDANENLDLTRITHFFVLRSDEDPVLASEDWDWYLDHFYLSRENFE